MKLTRKEYQKVSLILVKYNWEGIEFPAGSKHWEKFEQNNKTIPLNILFVPFNTKTIKVAFRSEYNNKHKNQVNLLMIVNGNKWHYLAVINLSALLEGKLSNHHGDFYCLNCSNSYTRKNKLKEHEEIRNNHDSCRIEKPKWFEKILKYNPGEKSLKTLFAIYLDSECLLKKEQYRQNNPEKSYTEKKAKHEGFLVGQCLQNVRLIKKKIKSIITEENIVLKSCVKN